MIVGVRGDSQPPLAQGSEKSASEENPYRVGLMATDRESRFISIGLRKNPKYREAESQAEPRYFLSVKCPLASLDQKGASIPLYWRLNPGSDIIHKEIYSCALLGEVIEKANLPTLIETVRWGLFRHLREGLLPAYFLAAASAPPVPVYLRARELTTTVGGVNIQGADIVELWRRVGDYLLNTRKIQNPDSVSILTVGSDLALIPPAALLFHPGPPPFRLPVLRGSSEAVGVFSYFMGQRVPQSRPKDNLLENIFSLWQETAEDLLNRSRISNVAELLIAQLNSAIWESRKALAATPNTLTFSAARQGPTAGKTFLEVYQREGKVLTALPTPHGTFMLFLASDPPQLAERVGSELVRQRLLEGTEQLTLQIGRKDR